MQLEQPADTRSPWYEAFLPPSAPSGPAVVWVIAPAAAPAGPDEAPDEAWPTEALFDYYND